MKYIILFILVYWIANRVFKLFAVVNDDPSSQRRSTADQDFKQTTKSKLDNKGEYVDFEEIE